MKKINISPGAKDAAKMVTKMLLFSVIGLIWVTIYGGSTLDKAYDICITYAPFALSLFAFIYIANILIDKHWSKDFKEINLTMGKKVLRSYKIDNTILFKIGIEWYYSNIDNEGTEFSSYIKNKPGEIGQYILVSDQKSGTLEIVAK
jgi:hypothetical protein